MKKILPITILLILALGIPAASQTKADLTVADMTLDTPSFTDVSLKLTYGYEHSLMGSRVEISADGIRISIDIPWMENGPVIFKVSDTDDHRGIFDPDHLYIMASQDNDTRIDLTGSPNDVTAIWTMSQVLVGELLENDTFLAEISTDENAEWVESELEKFSDGYYPPTQFSELLEVRFQVKPDFGGNGFRVSRGYNLMVNATTYDIYTFDASDDESDPELYFTWMEHGDEFIRYTAHFMPDSGTIAIENAGEKTPAEMDEICIALKYKMENILEMVMMQKDSMIEHGIQNADSELFEFSSLILEWIDEFERVDE
jgi:hypothetical protein